jgi:hypothetical protein
MNKPWLCSILAVAFVLFCLLKLQRINSLSQYYQATKVLKLKNFEAAKKKVSKADLDNLKVWESIITGRSRALSKMIKERYQLLALNHLFTPSGFHLSAVLFPFMRILKKQHHKLSLLIAVGIGLLFLPGLAALKRMLLIKTHQNVLGMKLGFVLALVVDIFFGSFQTGTLSFSYSFLFLGIIYSGLKGFGLIVWFFVAQIFLALFQGNDISPLLIVFSPILNFLFGLIMPVLFLLALPLWDWQLDLGLLLLKLAQKLVEFLALTSLDIPRFEVHIMVIIFVACLMIRKWKVLIILLIFMSNSLNLDRQVQPGMGSNAFVPQGDITKTLYSDKEVKVFFTDGKCKMKLVRGFWWEACSPSKKRSRNKRIKKLSYPS